MFFVSLMFVFILGCNSSTQNYLSEEKKVGGLTDSVEILRDEWGAGRGDDLNVNFLDHFELHGRRKLTLQVTAQGFGFARSVFDRIEQKSVFSARFNQLLE